MPQKTGRRRLEAVSDALSPTASQHNRPSRKQAEAAVRTLIEWAGADSDEAGHAFQSEAGHLFRREAGRDSDLMPATRGVVSSGLDG